jgi:predicted MFS family arabinose efflux permease
MRAPQRLTPLLGLIGGQIFLHASMAGLRMAAPLCVLREGNAEYAVGPLLALFSGAPVLLALPAGRLADRRGYRVPVRIAVALTMLGGLLALGSLYAGRAQYLGLCLAAVSSGAGGNIGMITIQRTAGRTARDATDLKRVFSWLASAPSVSNFVGPLLAGVLIDGYGFAAAFALLAAVPLLSLLCAPLVPQHEEHAHAREAQAAAAIATAPPKRRTAWDLLRLPALRRILLINWFMSTSWDVHAFLVPVIGHQRGLRASAIGGVLGVFALAATAVRLLIPILAHRLSEVRVLTSALAIVSLVFALYPWADTVWQMSACAIVLGFSLGCSQPMVMSRLHQITPDNRHGEAIALRSMTINFSSAVMPLGFAALGTALGAASLFWLMSALVAGGAFFARATPRGAPEHAPSGR